MVVPAGSADPDWPRCAGRRRDHDGLGFLETSINDFKEPGYILVCFTLRKDLKRRETKKHEDEHDSDIFLATVSA